MITQQKLREFFKYENGNLIRIKATRSQSIGKAAGWITECNGIKYKKINFDHQTKYLHRMIYLWHFGYEPKVIDHINNDSLDNRIENLREATQSQNCANQIVKKNNTSGYKGVRYRQDIQKWNATITVNRKSISLGCFVNKDDAAKAYAVGAKKYFGEFARTEQANARMEGRATE